MAARTWRWRRSGRTVRTTWWCFPRWPFSARAQEGFKFMAWTASTPTSRVFIQAVLNPLTASAWSTTEPTTYGANGLSADTINVALFNNSVSPDGSAAVGSTGYNTGVWFTDKEVTDATNWVAGGRALASKTYSVLTAGSQTTSAE